MFLTPHKSTESWRNLTSLSTLICKMICFWQLNLQLFFFFVEEYCIPASCTPLLMSDLHGFLCMLEKGRILDALCALNKGDSIDVFKLVSRSTNMNVQAALSYPCLLPRVFRAVPKTETVFLSLFITDIQECTGICL